MKKILLCFIFIVLSSCGIYENVNNPQTISKPKEPGLFSKDKDKGIYLDVGCFNPFMYSNTCLLYKKGWRGINIDINPTSIDLFNIARPNDFNICTTVNDEKKSFEVYQDDPFSPVNTLDKKFYESLEKSFFKDK